MQQNTTISGGFLEHLSNYQLYLELLVECCLIKQDRYLLTELSIWLPMYNI